MFASGSDSVIVRISEASNLFEGSTGLTPSVAVKFLVDGEESYNLFAMESFMPSDTWNFLEPQLTSRLEAFDTSTDTGYIMDQTLRKKMVEGS